MLLGFIRRQINGLPMHGGRFVQFRSYRPAAPGCEQH
jgi:hypothetical protein